MIYFYVLKSEVSVQILESLTMLVIILAGFAIMLSPFTGTKVYSKLWKKTKKGFGKLVGRIFKEIGGGLKWIVVEFANGLYEICRIPGWLITQRRMPPPRPRRQRRNRNRNNP